MVGSSLEKMTFHTCFWVPDSAVSGFGGGPKRPKGPGWGPRGEPKRPPWEQLWRDDEDTVWNEHYLWLETFERHAEADLVAAPLTHSRAPQDPRPLLAS